MAEDLLKLCGDSFEYLAIPNLDVEEVAETERPEGKLEHEKAPLLR